MACEGNILHELRILSIRNVLRCTVLVRHPGQAPAHHNTQFLGDTLFSAKPEIHGC